ncbi:MAG: hypothetical protein MRZ79_17035 [Bacteroidia bacterium]|nr:hypothetical protein [Bacteroidia bacterium]
MGWLLMGSINAQDLVLRDSLKQIWLDPENVDSIRFTACFDLLAQYYIYYHVDSVPHYGQQLFAQAKLAGNQFYQAQSLYAIGVAYENMADLSKAMDNYRRSLAIWEDINDLERQALLYSCIGGIYIKQGQYEESIQSVERAWRSTKKGEIAFLTHQPISPWHKFTGFKAKCLKQLKAIKRPST